MKITTVTSPDWDDPDETGSLTTRIDTDTYNESASFGRGEPEDNSLGRDLSDAWVISDMLVAAYEAGKRGEKLEFEEIEEE